MNDYTLSLINDQLSKMVELIEINTKCFRNVMSVTQHIATDLIDQQSQQTQQLLEENEKGIEFIKSKQKKFKDMLEGVSNE